MTTQTTLYRRLEAHEDPQATDYARLKDGRVRPQPDVAATSTEPVLNKDIEFWFRPVRLASKKGTRLLDRWETVTKFDRFVATYPHLDEPVLAVSIGHRTTGYWVEEDLQDFGGFVRPLLHSDLVNIDGEPVRL